MKKSHGRRCRAVEQRREILKLSRNFARAQYAVFLASNCARPAAALRDIGIFPQLAIVGDELETQAGEDVQEDGNQHNRIEHGTLRD